MEKENIENLFEEESNTQNEVMNSFVDLPPVAPIDYEKNDEELSIKEEPIIEEEINLENLNKEVLEHPDAKITLKTDEDEEIDKKELEELKEVKLSDNSSLKFVLILGLILLIVIFLIPVISEYI